MSRNLVITSFSCCSFDVNFRLHFFGIYLLMDLRMFSLGAQTGFKTHSHKQYSFKSCHGKCAFCFIYLALVEGKICFIETT